MESVKVVYIVAWLGAEVKFQACSADRHQYAPPHPGNMLPHLALMLGPFVRAWPFTMRTVLNFMFAVFSHETLNYGPF